jgi:hypothetical protein
MRAAPFCLLVALRLGNAAGEDEVEIDITSDGGTTASGSGGQRAGGQAAFDSVSFGLEHALGDTDEVRSSFLI